MQYINVIINNKSKNTDRPFTYRADNDVQIGDKVFVEFANRKKPVEAYVVETGIKPEIDNNKIKNIQDVDKERSLNREMIDVSAWMAKRYGTKLIDCINLFTVKGKRAGKVRIDSSKNVTVNDKKFTDEQQKAYDEIEKSLQSQEFHAFLLKGVTNSGKTEIYLQAAGSVIRKNGNAIILVPEIALAGELYKRFIERFGSETVSLLHSKMTNSARLAEWLKIRSGKTKIVIGARAAIFAPIENIGLIVIDEEHEATYKSDHNPKYETLDIAFKRAMINKSTLLLGSATPAIANYYRSQNGIFSYLKMDKRIGKSKLPKIEIVDMKAELIRGNSSIFSNKLVSEIKKTLSNGEQVILFLNRRGFSTGVICADCGARMTCPNCNISFTYHKKENSMICHYCGKKMPLVKTCPNCKKNNIKLIGTGTEKVLEEATSLFQEAKIERFDLDTAKNEKEIEDIINKFINKEIDILVGTQILAKGIDFQNVSLVGIILADTTLNIPDYRASERTFQLITQVSGRAGRDGKESKVIIQTFDPDNKILRMAAKNNYEDFYENELIHRKIMNYPPFSDIIEISLYNKETSEAKISDNINLAKNFRNLLLNSKDLPAGSIILEPVASNGIGRSKNKVSFIIKAPKGTRNWYINRYLYFSNALDKIKSKSYSEIDINPY